MSNDTGFVYHFGGHAPSRTVRPGEEFDVFTEDCFSGKLTSEDGQPREVAPFPKVNPLTGPVEIEGVKAGDVIAVRILSMIPARDWGVATVSPNFGLLSGTRLEPNLQPEQEERVWIWRFAEDRRSLSAKTKSGPALNTDYRPFFGTIGVAPAHGETRLCVVPGDFGGNLDVPDLGPGATLYLRANVDGAHLYVGDGHYAQGDGEMAGTAIEGAFNARLRVDRVETDAAFEWPRIETETQTGVVGVGRPLDSALKVAATGLVKWISATTGLDALDAYQLVSQTATIRIGNVVNPDYTVLVSISKRTLAEGSVSV